MAKRSSRSMPPGATQSDDQVGYGRPPRHSRFPPGQSGNPAGRPRHAKNLSTILTEEMNKLVAVREGGKVRKRPKRNALVASMVNKALAGDPRAVGQLLPVLLRLEAEQAARGQATEILAQDDQQLLAAYLRRAQSNGSEDGQA